MKAYITFYNRYKVVICLMWNIDVSRALDFQTVVVSCDLHIKNRNYKISKLIFQLCTLATSQQRIPQNFRSNANEVVNITCLFKIIDYLESKCACHATKKRGQIIFRNWNRNMKSEYLVSPTESNHCSKGKKMRYIEKKLSLLHDIHKCINILLNFGCPLVL